MPARGSGETGTVPAVPRVCHELSESAEKLPGAAASPAAAALQTRLPPGSEGHVPLWIWTSLWANHTSADQTGILQQTSLKILAWVRVSPNLSNRKGGKEVREADATTL